MMSIVTSLIERSAGSSSQCNMRKGEKMQTDWKVRNKTAPSCRGIIVYVENPQESTKQTKNNNESLLELISEFGKVAGCNMNIQESISAVYTSNEHVYGKIKVTAPFTVTEKHSGVNLTD